MGGPSAPSCATTLCTGLTLYTVIRELQTLLAVWTGGARDRAKFPPAARADQGRARTRPELIYACPKAPKVRLALCAQTHGCRRVAAQLARNGIEASVDLDADLMREQDLAAVQPRAYKTTTVPGETR